MRPPPNTSGPNGRGRRNPPSWLDDVEVQTVQPYLARKTYHCPGCGREIREGLGHLVVVPREAPDLRRHWHRGCWTNELRRR